MNIFTNLFFTKYSPKRTKLHRFLKKISQGSIPPDPPSMQYNT